MKQGRAQASSERIGDMSESPGFNNTNMIVRFLDPGPVQIQMHPGSMQVL